MHPGRSLVLTCALVGSAHADDKADKAEADKHYQLGKRHYNLTEWDEAIAEFKSAYKLFPDPVNLYNIAQAYRLKGKNCTNAAQFYASYQREEKSRKLRDSVTKVRKDMEACAKTEKPDEPLPVPPPVPAPVGEAPTTPPPLDAPPVAPSGDDAMRLVEPAPPVNLDPNRNRRILGYVMIGGGATLVLGGVLYSGKVSDLDRELDGCDLFGCDSGADPRELKDRRARTQINANACFGLGLAAVAGGGLLYLLSRKPKQDRVTVVPARGGAAVRFAF